MAEAKPKPTIVVSPRELQRKLSELPSTKDPMKSMADIKVLDYNGPDGGMASIVFVRTAFIDNRGNSKLGWMLNSHFNIVLRDEAPEPVPEGTCPVCRHAYHGNGICFNMASDNECNCKGVEVKSE